MDENKNSLAASAELEDSLYRFACRALEDGGIASPTWLRYRASFSVIGMMAGICQSHAEGLRRLYRVYGRGQAIRGWTHVEDGRLRAAAVDGTLHLQPGLSPEFLDSVVYRAWWMHQGLPLVEGHGHLILEDANRAAGQAPGFSPPEQAVMDSAPDNPWMVSFLFPERLARR